MIDEFKKALKFFRLPIREHLKSLFSLLAGVLFNVGFLLFVSQVWPKLKASWHVWWLTLVGTASVLAVGLGLFTFKKHYQRFYGLGEIGFALAVAWTSIVRARSIGDSASWLATLAAAYLIVRGLTNYTEAKKRE